MATILVVDDDVEIADLVEIYLTNDGFTVDKARDGEECLEKLKENPDIRLVILDIMMPKLNGIEACKEIRRTSNVPIIMLSAKTSDMDKIMGLGTGADDYVTKPFNPLELIARVKAQLRRYQSGNMAEAKEQTLQVGELVLDKVAHQVTKGENPIALTPIEFEILSLLLSHPGRVYSTDEIFEQVWKEKVYEVNNTVMVHIRRLREKIEDEPKNPRIILTVWGVGYKIDA